MAVSGNDKNLQSGAEDHFNSDCSGKLGIRHSFAGADGPKSGAEINQSCHLAGCWCGHRDDAGCAIWNCKQDKGSACVLGRVGGAVRNIGILAYGACQGVVVVCCNFRALCRSVGDKGCCDTDKGTRDVVAWCVGGGDV